MAYRKDTGNTFESGTFVLNAAGTSITGSITGSTAEITLEVSGAAAVIRIPTAKTLKLWQGLTFETANSAKWSDGNSNGAIQWCSGSAIEDAFGSDKNNCIHIKISDGGFPLSTLIGWTGLITTITSTYFEITLTQVGAGLLITGKFHLIEG